MVSSLQNSSARVYSAELATRCVAESELLIIGEGIQVIRLPPRSPNLNAYAERFVRSVKEECISRMIFIGRSSLERALAQYMAHYHTERNHQGLANRLLRPELSIATQ